MSFLLHTLARRSSCEIGRTFVCAKATAPTRELLLHGSDRFFFDRPRLRRFLSHDAAAERGDGALL